jgi:hypothetical protein
MQSFRYPSARLAILLISLILSSCAHPAQRHPSSEPSSSQPSAPWSFVVLSDIHVDPRHLHVSHEFEAVVKNLTDYKAKQSENPKQPALRFVVINGDSTNGNTYNHDPEKIHAWWKAFEAGIEPLLKHGIPVFIVPGNHDTENEIQTRIYGEAAHSILQRSMHLADPGIGNYHGHEPLFYSFDVDQAHFSLLELVTESVEPEKNPETKGQEAWLENDLAAAKGTTFRFALGHVPLESVLGQSVPDYSARLGGLFACHGLTAFIAGHEHMVWDMNVKTPHGDVHQLTVGTASGTYYFPMRRPVVEQFCQGRHCQLPGSGLWFDLKPPKDKHPEVAREQLLNETLLWVTLSPEEKQPKFQFLALDHEALVPFATERPTGEKSLRLRTLEHPHRSRNHHHPHHRHKHSD